MNLFPGKAIQQLIQKTYFSDMLVFSHTTTQAQNILLQEKIHNLQGTLYETALGAIPNTKPHAYHLLYPLTHYHQIHDLVVRCFQGEKDVLCQGSIDCFAKSSGTSSGSQGLSHKLIPISDNRIHSQELSASLRALGAYCEHYPHTQLFSYLQGYGHAITLGGGSREEKNTDGDIVTVSYISGLFAENTPFFLKPRRHPSKKTAKLSGTAKFRAIWEEIQGKKISLISGVCMLVKDFLYYLLNQARNPECDRIDEPSYRASFQSLELVILGGGPMSNFRQDINALLGKNLAYIQTHNASEGFFGAQLRNHEDTNFPRMQLLNTCYYEFLPKSVYMAYVHHFEHEQAIVRHRQQTAQELYKQIEPEILNCKMLLQKLQDGSLSDTEYVMIISTDTLTRFVIGDVVRFNLASKQSIEYVVSGRLSFSMNNYNEHVEQMHIIKTIASLGEGFVQEPFMVCYEERPDIQVAYRIYLEYEGNNLKSQDRANLFDKTLQEVNEQYQIMRQEKKKFAVCSLLIVHKGTLYRSYQELDEKEHRNLIGPQFKIPLMKESNTAIMNDLKTTQVFQDNLMRSSLFS